MALGSTKNLLLRISDVPLSTAEITAWLRDLRGNPYVPWSNYDVSAVLRMRAGARHMYFGGVNVEYPEARISTHGEEGAIAALVTALGRHAAIDEVWVMGAPSALSAPSPDPLADICGQCCGNCRQRITGFADAGVMVHPISLNGRLDSERLSNLLPKSFSFRDFAPEKMRARDAFTYDGGEGDLVSRLVRDDRAQTKSDIDTWLHALTPWDLASGRGEAVVVEFEGHRYAASVRVEDAAFTGTSAVQGAFAVACAAWHGVGHTIKPAAIYMRAHKDDEDFLRAGVAQVLASFAPGETVPLTIENWKG